MAKEVAVFAAGCFWGVEELIRKVPGVLSTEVGYCGGAEETATYAQVKQGLTGHAEAVRVEFESDILTYESVIRLFFKLHDPTTLNSQGNDIGTQYRSAIFYLNEIQKICAEKIIDELTRGKIFKDPIVTQVVHLENFYSAEEYHQDYLQKNPQGYMCHYWRK